MIPDHMEIFVSACLQVYGKKVAVRNLSLELHQGEILALLGHNGAGALAPGITHCRAFTYGVNVPI